MRVARLYKADDIRIEDIPVPEPGPGQALVRTRACGICTGDIMGWYMERKAPLVFGHEPAGEIAAVGDGVTEFAVGDRVFVHHHAPCGSCRHCRRGHHVHCRTWRSTRLVPGGMAEFFLVEEDNLRADTLRLPDGVDFVAGSLVEPAACVVKSLRRGGLEAEDTVAVVGLGIMGQLHVALAKAAGARVVGADLVPFRLERALALGADAVIDVRQRSLADGVRDSSDQDLPKRCGRESTRRPREGGWCCSPARPRMRCSRFGLTISTSMRSRSFPAIRAGPKTRGARSNTWRREISRWGRW
jgi:L-iditol 2-dehydrogenase